MEVVTGPPRRAAPPAAKSKPEARPANKTKQTGGPGTELKRLIVSLGLTAVQGCGCDKWAGEMDSWGVAGCEARREEILARLRESQSKLGWVEKTKAAVLAVKTGLAFKLDPLDPAPGLLDEAVRRAGLDRPV